MGEDDLMNGIENNRYFPLVKARAEVEGAEAIPICAKTEEDIAEYTPEEKAEFLAEMGIESKMCIRDSPESPPPHGSPVLR